MIFFLYTVVLLLLLEPILKINSFGLINEDFVFTLLCNYILNIATALFFGYFNNLLYTLLCAFALSFFSIILIKRIKDVFGYFKINSLFYLIFVLFFNVYILINFIKVF